MKIDSQLTIVTTTIKIKRKQRTKILIENERKFGSKIKISKIERC